MAYHDMADFFNHLSFDGYSLNRDHNYHNYEYKEPYTHRSLTLESHGDTQLRGYCYFSFDEREVYEHPTLNHNSNRLVHLSLKGKVITSLRKLNI